MKRRIVALAALSGLTSACSNAPHTIVNGPTSVAPAFPVAALETHNPGAIYQPGGTSYALLYQDAPVAHAIGDTLKIRIAESTSGSNKLTTSTSRANTVATKGPGTTDDSLPGVVKSVLNLDAKASGSDTFDGSGTTESSNSLKGQLAASVINVLPNGNLMVAGEKSIAFNGSISTLRFSGIVNPHDIKADNVVDSSDVIDAHLEQVGDGAVSDSNSKSHMQKLLSDWLSVW